MHFLDKFVYRNPKANESKRGGSIMQPVHATGASSNIVVPAKAGPTARSSVNNASFWNLQPDQVAAEDVFFHEYFGQIGRPAQAAKKAKREVDEAASEDEEAEEEIWEALVHSRPEVGGEDDDDDEDMADLEEGYGSDSDEDLDLVDMGSDEEEDGEGGGAELGSDAGVDGFEGIFGDSDDDGEGWEDEDDGGDDEEDEDAGKSKKWKERRERKKELKGLPTFASADDYAEMLSRDDDLDDPNL
jgi:ribosome biogenesis protein MAK21